MNPKALIQGQNIRICDHRRCGAPHDWNDPTADIHLHKEPNSGTNFHCTIRIPLRGEPTFDVKSLFADATKYKEIRQKLQKEIEEAFGEKNADTITKNNFIREIVAILHNEWNDKLSSVERAKDIAMRVGKAFGLGKEVENIIRRNTEGELSQYTSISNSAGTIYFSSVFQDHLQVGEVSGKMKSIYKIK